MERKCDIYISIIVPVYNVEMYLSACLDSLINQTLKNIEIILVNDCSKDNSESIILDYRLRDSRIVYLKHENNSGQGAARNTALNYAKGEFALFVDSDDSIAIDTAEVLYNNAKRLNLDILEANYFKVSSENTNKQTLSLFPNVLTGNEYFEEIPFTVGVIWNKLWNISFIKSNNLKFVDHIFEDVRFISESILFSKRIFRINYSFYYYNIRDNSTMTSEVTDKHINAQMKLLNFLETSYNDNKSLKGSSQRLKLLLYAFSSLATFLSKYNAIEKSHKLLKQKAKYLISEKYSLYRNQIFLCDKLGVKQKVLFYISPYLVSFILKRIK